MGILVELAIEFGGTTVFVTAYGKLGQAGAVQAKLAQMVHVSRQTINAVETENYDPSLDLAFRLGTWFGCPIEGIFEPNSR